MHAPAPDLPRLGLIRSIVMTMRPHQWVKNLFVVAPLIFAGKLLDSTALLTAGTATLLFCLLSSAVYVFNDLCDREADRLHPIKQFRPIASGSLSVRAAYVAVALLALLSLGGAFWLGTPFAAILGIYAVLNLAYTLRLKHVPFLDVTIIAVGFICRVTSGAVAIDVTISYWLIICTFLLSAYLGFGKRRHELTLTSSDKHKQRRVLKLYNPEILDRVLRLIGLLTAMAYVFYTLSDLTLRKFGTWKLVFSAPMIMLGLFRFLQLTNRPKVVQSPTDAMLRDPVIIGSVLVWGLTIVPIIYHWV